MTINYTVAIGHHASWIWDQLNTDNTVSTDTYAWVAADLESAEACVDEYRFQAAAGFILSAARQVFGVYSDTYADLVHFYA